LDETGFHQPIVDELSFLLRHEIYESEYIRVFVNVQDLLGHSLCACINLKPIMNNGYTHIMGYPFEPKTLLYPHLSTCQKRQTTPFAHRKLRSGT